MWPDWSTSEFPPSIIGSHYWTMHSVIVRPDVMTNGDCCLRDILKDSSNSPRDVNRWGRTRRIRGHIPLIFHQRLVEIPYRSFPGPIMHKSGFRMTLQVLACKCYTTMRLQHVKKWQQISWFWNLAFSATLRCPRSTALLTLLFWFENLMVLESSNEYDFFSIVFQENRWFPVCQQSVVTFQVRQKINTVLSTQTRKDLGNTFG